MTGRSSLPPPKPRLLIVDDEIEVIESLRRTLRREPYNVLTATSALTALEMLEERSVDLLLSDIDMPGMDGLELVAEVRQRHPEIVRMVLTGDASLSSVLTAINTGEVHRYFLKPWDNEELRSMLARALARKDELARQAEATLRVGQREKLLEALENAYPGIGTVRRDAGAYLLSLDRLKQHAAATGVTRLVELFGDGSRGRVGGV